MTTKEDFTTQLDNEPVSDDNRRFVSAPKAVESFLLQNEKNVLLLGTFDVGITKERILHNVPNSEEVTESQLLSAKLNFKSGSKLLVYSNTSNILALISRVTKDFGYNHYKVVILLPSSDLDVSVKLLGDLLKFFVYSNDEISWKCLHKDLQTKIKLRLKQKNTWLLYNDDTCFDTLKEIDVIKLINNNEGLIYANSVPDKPSYYVERTIVSRNVISQALFDKPTNDLWLIENFNDPLLLIEQMGKHHVDSCSNQLRGKEITDSFLKVDMSDSFEHICSRTNKSVHLIKYEKGNYYWVKTRGNITGVISLIDFSHPTVLSESEFLGIVTQNNSVFGNAILISDTPGMGKSYLVSSLGRKLQQTYPNRLVVYLTCSYLIEQASLVRSQDLNKESLGIVLVNAMTFNDFARHIILNHLQSSATTNIELILDGFDEVSAQYFSSVGEFLLKLQFCYPNIRFWLTTRPHYLEYLQVLFTTIGYTISHFNSDNQLYFLQRCWVNAAEVENKKVNSYLLKKYSQFCVSYINKSLDKPDNEIVGVPLQCKLVADIFKDDAIKYSFSDGSPNLRYWQRFKFKSILELIDILVNSKLNSYFRKKHADNLILRDKLLDLHSFYGLLLLFPKNADTFRDMLWHSDILQHEILAVGLMQTDNNSKTLMFIHRAFAEYFVAKLSFKMLTARTVLPSFHGFLSTNVFASNNSSVGSFFKYASKTIRTYEFQELAVCQFLNCLSADINIKDFMLQPSRLLDEFYSVPLLLKKIGHACAKSNLLFLFKLVFPEFAVQRYANYSFIDKEFLTVVVFQCDVSFVKYCANLYNENSKSSIEYIRIESCHFLGGTPEQVSLLHVALAEGSFSIVEFFLKHTKFQSYLATKHKDFLDLIQKCVEWSGTDTQDVINGKKKILKYLASDENFSWLFSTRPNGVEPICCKNVHLAYIELLLISDSDRFLVNSENQTVFHEAAKKSSDDLHRLLLQASKVLSSSKMSYLLNLQDNFGRTVLHLLCSESSPSVSILKFFKKFDADFNSVGKSFTPLCSAISSSKGIKIVSLLISFGADPSFRFGDQSNLIHFAAKYGQVKTFNYLLSLKLQGISLDSKDIYGRTPLHYAAMQIIDDNILGRRLIIDHYLTSLSSSKPIRTFQSAYGNENLKISIEKGFSLFKVICFQDNKESVKAVLVLQKKVTEVESPDNSLLIFVVYNKNMLYFSKDGIEKDTHHFVSTQIERVKIFDVICVLSKKIKFSLWHLHIISHNSKNPAFIDDLLKWILEQNVSEKILLELLASVFERYPLYICKQSNILSLALKLEKSLNVIKWILSRGVLVNVSDENGNSPLHVAMSSTSMSRHEYILWLLDAGAEINAKNFCNRTPFSISCWNRILNDTMTFKIFIANGALCNSDVASSALYWLIFSMPPENEFINVANLIIEMGANIYIISEEHDSTLLDLTRKKLGQKCAFMLENVYKNYNNGLKSRVNELNGEEACLINLLAMEFFSFANKFKNINVSKIDILPAECLLTDTTHVFTRTLRKERSGVAEEFTAIEPPKTKLYAVRHFKHIFNSFKIQTNFEMLPLIAFVVDRNLPECLEFLFEWFEKKIGGDLTECELTCNNGFKYDLLVTAVQHSNLECVEYLVEKVGFKKHLFTDKYKYLIHQCIHLEQSGKLIEYIGDINPDLICWNQEILFASENLNPNAFSAVAKIVGNFDAFTFTNKNLNNTSDKLTILHKIIQIIDSEKFHNIVEDISRKGLLSIFEPNDRIQSPLLYALKFFEVQCKTINLLARSDVAIESNVMYSASALKKSFNLIKCLISNGVDVSDTIWHSDKTTLHYLVASYIESEEQLGELLQCLLENSILSKLNCIDKYGNTVFHEIFTKFKLTGDLLKFLLNSPQTTFANNLKQNLLHLSIANKTCPTELQQIISNKIRLFQQDIDGKTCVHIAALKYSPNDFKEFIQILKANCFLGVFNVRDRYTQTPVMYAASRHEILTVLLNELSNEQSIDWNILDSNEINFLCHAALANDLIDLEDSFTKAIIHCRANIRQQDSSGATIAHYVISSGKDFHWLVVFLLKHNFHDILFISEGNGLDSIALALSQGVLSPSTLRILIEKDNKFICQSLVGQRSYLHFAAQSKMQPNIVECIKLLITNGVDPRLRTEKGATFLHQLVQSPVSSQLDEIVKHLVSRNLAEVLTEQDFNGHTPISLAIRTGCIFPQTINFLSSNAVDLSWKSSNTLTLLHIAAENFNFDLIKSLLNTNVDYKALNSNGYSFLHVAPKHILDHVKCNHEIMKIYDKAEKEAARVFEELTTFISSTDKTDIFTQVGHLGNLPLHESMRFFDVTLKTLKIFQESGVDLDMPDSNGYSLLFHAILGKRSMSFIKALIQIVAVAKPNKDGFTIAHYLFKICAADRYHEIVKYLFDLGYGYIFFIRNSYLTPFILTVGHQEILPETLNLLIEEYKKLNEELEKTALPSFVEKESILFYVAYNKRSVSVLKTLISSGIDINTTVKNGNNVAHFTSLYYSAPDFHDIINHIVGEGFGYLLNTPNDLGLFAVSSAVSNLEILPETLYLITGKQSQPGAKTNPSTTSDLLSKGVKIASTEFLDQKVDLNASDINGETVLFHAVKSNRTLPIIKLLVELGANPLAKSNHNSSLLHTASSFSNSIDQMKYFVDLGLDVNELDNDGDNCLHCLVFDNNADIYEMLVYLVKAGVNKTHRNKIGKTAHDYAVDKKISDPLILNLLL